MSARATVHHDAATNRCGSTGLSASAGIQLPPTRTGTLRVLTFNILFGRNWAESLAVIRDADADVICLQEVVPDDSFYAPFTPIDRIIDDIAMPHDYAYLWGRGEKRLGNLTFARDDVAERTILRTWPTPAYGMANRVSVGTTRLTIANIHLSPMLGPPPLMFWPSECLRRLETGHLSRWAQSHCGPIVAAGDYNSFAMAPATRRMARGWQDARIAARGATAPTRRTYGLPFVIDHIFVRGGLAACEYTVLPGGGSDHRAVLATLKVPFESAFVASESAV